MQRRRTLHALIVCAGLMLGSLANGALAAETVDEIVARHVAARGGAEKLKSIESVHMTGTLELPGMSATLVSDQKRPDLMRMDMSTPQFTATRAFDGKTGWTIMPQENQPDPKPMDADDRKAALEEADFLGPLVDYKTKGHKLELLGHEQVDGHDCCKLKLTTAGSGEVRTIWLDAQTFLERRVAGGRKTEKGEESYVQTLDDYRDVDGAKFPFLSVVDVTSPQGNGKYTYKVEKIELNKPIESSRFEMPAAMPATQPGK
jgi:outer membrane lipoprotein-sorting protein